MSEKKVVSRNTAIVLGILCIILAVGLILTYMNYIPRSNITSVTRVTTLDKDKTVNIPAGGTVTLSYSTPSAGSITVNYTSTI